MPTFQSHSLHDVYELWRRGRAFHLGLVKGESVNLVEFQRWLSELDRFLEEPDLDPSVRGQIAAPLNASRSDSQAFTQVASVASSLLKKLLLFPDGMLFAPRRVARSSLVTCLQAAIDDTEDNPYLGWSVQLATLAERTELPIDEVRRAVCGLVEKELAYFVEGEDDTIVDERFNIEDERAERQLQRWQMEAAVATTARISVAIPTTLPNEWRDLVVGIAGKHGFSAQLHLTGNELVVDLATYADGHEVREAALAVGSEIEQALAAPSRLKQETTQTFINHGQAGAMGPNAVASNNTFQQQVNVKPLDSDEQRQLVEQLGNLLDQLRRDATSPEEFTALAEVSRAQLEAKNGNRAGVVGALKRAGKWVQETAENISAKVIVSLIKDS